MSNTANKKKKKTTKNFFKKTLPKFGRMFVSMYLSMYVFLIAATPFNLQLSNFGITFLMWLSKTSFFKLLKKCFFSRVIALFLHFFKISVTLKSNYVKTNGDRNDILFCTLINRSNAKFQRKNCWPKVRRFFFCMPVFLSDCLPD